MAFAAARDDTRASATRGNPLERTRIVLIDMAPLLREIVRAAVVREPDLDIVAEHDEIDVRSVLELDDPDFIIVGENAATAEDLRVLVGVGRGLRALEVQSDGRESVLYELRPHRISLGEISSDTLVRAIRTVPTWDAKS